MFFKGKQISQAYETGAVLAVAGGFLDSYTYVSRGGVFANAQTGNMVLLAVNIAKKNIMGTLIYFIPIIAFVTGILAAEYIRKLYKDRDTSRLHWRQSIILAEAVILGAIAFVPSGSADTAVNVLVSFVCSLQVESFRKINGNAAATTMCTGNLRSASENLFKYETTKDREFLKKSLQYYGIIVFFILGSVAGYIMTDKLGVKAVLFCVLLLAVIFTLMFINGDKAE